MNENDEQFPPREGNFRFDQQDAFLEEFAKTGRLTQSMKTCGLSTRSHYAWLQNDPSYGPRYRAAQKQVGDRLEEEAIRRGMHGVSRPVLHQGQVVMVWKDLSGNIADADTPGAKLEPLVEHEYSDSLLTKLLIAHKPKKYSERHVHTHKHRVFEPREERLAKLAERVKQLKAEGVIPEHHDPEDSTLDDETETDFDTDVTD